MPSIPDLLERDCVMLVESTIPAGMTIADWRRRRVRHRVEARRGPSLRWVRGRGR